MRMAFDILIFGLSKHLLHGFYSLPERFLEPWAIKYQISDFSPFFVNR